MDLSGVKKTDIGVAAYLLAAIIFFIVPIPSILLVLAGAQYFRRIDRSNECLVCAGSFGYVLFPDPAFVYDDLSYFPKRFIYPSDPKYGFAGKCR